jgi:hypothetical protein
MILGMEQKIRASEEAGCSKVACGKPRGNESV